MQPTVTITHSGLSGALYHTSQLQLSRFASFFVSRHTGGATNFAAHNGAQLIAHARRALDLRVVGPRSPSFCALVYAAAQESHTPPEPSLPAALLQTWLTSSPTLFNVIGQIPPMRTADTPDGAPAWVVPSIRWVGSLIYQLAYVGLNADGEPVEIGARAINSASANDAVWAMSPIRPLTHQTTPPLWAWPGSFPSVRRQTIKPAPGVVYHWQWGDHLSLRLPASRRTYRIEALDHAQAVTMARLVSCPYPTCFFFGCARRDRCALERIGLPPMTSPNDRAEVSA